MVDCGEACSRASVSASMPPQWWPRHRTRRVKLVVSELGKMRNATLLIFAISIGECHDRIGFTDKRLAVEEQHVAHAFKLFTCLHGIARAWASTGPQLRPDRNDKDIDLVAAGMTPESQFGECGLTQAQANSEVGGDVVHLANGPEIDASGVANPPPPGWHGARVAVWRVYERLSPTWSCCPPPTKVYGVQAASVHYAVFGGVVMSDREWMMKMMQRREVTFYGRCVIDSLSAKQRSDGKPSYKGACPNTASARKTMARCTSTAAARQCTIGARVP